MRRGPSTLISLLTLTLTLTLILNLTTVLAAPPSPATPPPNPQPPGRTHPADITCYGTPGPGLIVLDDCMQALAKTPFYSPSGPAGYRIGVDTRRTFTYREAASADHALSGLPQAFAHGTCNIFLDLPLGARSAVASWAEIEAWIRELVDQCVAHEGGLAGKSHRGGVTVTLFKRGAVGGLRGSLGPDGASLLYRLTGGRGGGRVPLPQ